MSRRVIDQRLKQVGESVHQQQYQRSLGTREFIVVLAARGWIKINAILSNTIK